MSSDSSFDSATLVAAFALADDDDDMELCFMPDSMSVMLRIRDLFALYSRICERTISRCAGLSFDAACSTASSNFVLLGNLTIPPKIARKHPKSPEVPRNVYAWITCDIVLK